jgi:hypothetical protein
MKKVAMSLAELVMTATNFWRRGALLNKQTTG